MNIFKKTICTLSLAFMTSTASAQVNVISNLLDTSKPVLAGAVYPLTSPLAENAAFQQGSLQVAGTISPIINGLLSQGGNIALQLTGFATTLDTFTLPGLESVDGALLDVGATVEMLPLIR